MGTLWFSIIGFLLIGYAVLDGFDLGVGLLHPFVAKTDEERQTVLNTIGPVWDGNEVWLIVGGGSLFMAFPSVYAAGFSGFYLALIIVLWLLMGRGLSLEFRGRLNDPLWRPAADFVFSACSTLLMLLFGIALGNVIHGVPIDTQGYYQGLFEWMLNPYALLVGVLAVAVLALHGSNWLSLKTTGAVQDRSRRIGRSLWWVVVALALIATVATFLTRSEMGINYKTFPPWVLVPLAAAASLAAVWVFRRRNDDGRTFWSSTLLIVALSISTGIGLYPYLLPSRPHPERSFTVTNAAAPSGSLFPATIWVTFALALTIAYTIFVYSTFKGKVSMEGEHY